MYSTKRMIGAVVMTTALTAGCANTGQSETAEGEAPAAAGCGEGDGPIRIGVIAPLSGPAGPNGQDVLEAIETQADIINEEGGVLGRQLEVVSRDDQSTPASGVSAANDLIAQGVSVIMGGWNSPVTLAIQPVTDRADVLNITTIPQNAAIIGGADPTAIRLNAGNAVGGYVGGQYIVNELDGQRVAMLLQNDAYGNDAGTFLTETLQELGAEVVGTEKFEYTDTDFRIPLSNVAGADADVVFSANAAESSGMPALVSQYQQSGIEAPHFAGLGTVSPKVIDLAGGDAVNGLFSADIYFPEAPPFDSLEANQTFLEAFQEATGALPDKYSALGAQSVEIWAQAVEEAGTCERQAVADAVQGQSFSDTILGDVSFTDAGQMRAPVYGFEVVDGQIEVRDEIEVPDEVWGE